MVYYLKKHGQMCFKKRKGDLHLPNWLPEEAFQLPPVPLLYHIPRKMQVFSGAFLCLYSIVHRHTVISFRQLECRRMPVTILVRSILSGAHTLEPVLLRKQAPFFYQENTWQLINAKYAVEQ